MNSRDKTHQFRLQCVHPEQQNWVLAQDTNTNWPRVFVPRHLFHSTSFVCIYRLHSQRLTSHTSLPTALAMAAQSPSDVELPNLTKKSSTTKEPSACSIHSNNRRDSSVEAPASDEWVQVDLFTPFPAHPDLPVENYPLTLRAVLVGWVLGAVVNASNVYVG